MALPPAYGLQKLVEAAGLETAPWKFFTGKLPAEPNTAVAFIDRGGKDPEVKVAIDYPEVQVLVRGSTASGGYVSSFDLITAIKNALLGIPEGGVIYPELDGVVARGEIQSLGYDDKNRPLWSMNFSLTVSHTVNMGHRDYA